MNVNRKDLAGLLGVSLPTVTALIERYSDFPILERGSKGIEWKFDAPAVVEFLRAKREQQVADKAARDEELAQLTLPILPLEEKPQGVVSLDDRLKAAKLREIETREAKERRFLVPTHEVRGALEKALRRYGQVQTSMLERVMKKHNLPEAVKRALEMEFADARTAFARDAGEFLTAPDGEQAANDALL